METAKKETTKGEPCKILSCSCKHEWQDKQYGNGMRLMNATKSNSYRCTVCGRVR